MKKLILTLILLIMALGCSGSRGLIAPEFTALKANEDVNAFKAEVQSLKNDMSVIKGNLDANAQAVAGVGNEIKKMSAGRDMTTTTTNETTLMMYIIKSLAGLCATLIGILGWCLKTLIRREKQKAFYKEQAILKTETEDDLLKMRELHDQYIKGGKKK